jgi:hypothetical protein
MSRGKKGFFSGLALLGLVLLLVGSVGAQTATSDAVAGADDLAPGPVSEVTATADEVNKTVAITWMVSEDDYIRQTAAGTDFSSGGVFISVNDVAGYDVMLSVDGGTAEAVNATLLAPSATSYTDEELPPGTSFVYSVVAVDASGLESAAVAAEAVTLGPPPQVEVTDPVDAVKKPVFEFTLQLAELPADLPAFKQKAQAELAAALGVPADQIRIIAVVRGSVIVLFEVLDDTIEDPAAALNEALVDNPDVLAELGPVVGEVGTREVTEAAVNEDGEAAFGLANTSDDPLAVLVASAEVVGAGFSVTPESITIAQGDDPADFVVSFDPQAVGNINGTYTGSLTISTNDPDNPTSTKALSAVITDGVEPAALDLSKAEFKFGQVKTDDSATQTLTITNKGGAELTATLALSGEDVFTIDPASVTVAVDETAEVTITFAPVAEGSFEATITITSNDPANPEKTVALSGRGVLVVDEGIPGDFDGDKDVDFDDFFQFADFFGTTTESDNWNPIYDLDDSGDVGFDDFFQFADNFGRTE